MPETRTCIERHTGPSDSHFAVAGAAAAFMGPVVYFTSAMLHPWTPPHETAAAFAHYAQEAHWGMIHLGEFLGALIMSFAGIALAWRLRRGPAGVWAMLAAATMIVFVAVYAIFAAVDGVALGVLVRRLAASSSESGLLFETAYAVRQVEAGLFALQWFVFGCAALLFAPAFFLTRGIGRWAPGMGALSLAACLGAVTFGVVQAQDGFTATSMAFQTGLYVGVAWIILAGVFLLATRVRVT